MRNRVKHRAPKWQACEVLRLPEDGSGSVRAITSRDGENTYTYHPCWLPGNPQTGDTVELCWGYFDGVRQHRCRVAGREYVLIAYGPVWKAVDTGEIIRRVMRVTYLGEMTLLPEQQRKAGGDA